MGDALFYHLTQGGAEATLLQLLPKALGAGWQVELRGTDRAGMQQMDEALWRGPDDGFLPHGLAGGDHDADQPVLLTWDGIDPTGRACLMMVQGAHIPVEDVAARTRVCILFDGHDPAAVDHARGQWRAVTGAGISAQYWAQDGGRWVKKAET